MAEGAAKLNPRVKVCGWARALGGDGGARMDCVEILRGDRIDDAVMVVSDGIGANKGKTTERALGSTRFDLDVAFGPSAGVADVFGKLKGSITGCVLQGIDSTVFLHFGSPELMRGVLYGEGKGDSSGLAELTGKALFADLPGGYQVTLGVVQVVGNTVCDLLNVTAARVGLGLETREGEDGSIRVEGLKRPVVENARAAVEVVRKGMANAQWGEEKEHLSVHTVFLYEVEAPDGTRTQLNIVGLSNAVHLRGRGSTSMRAVQQIVSFLMHAAEAGISPEAKAMAPLQQEAPNAKRAPRPDLTRESKVLRIIHNALHPDAHVTVLGVINPAHGHSSESKRVLFFTRKCLKDPKAAATLGDHESADVIVKNNILLQKRLEEMSILYEQQKALVGLPLSQGITAEPSEGDGPVKEEEMQPPSPQIRVKSVAEAKESGKMTAVSHDVLMNSAIVSHLSQLAMSDKHRHTLKLLDAEKQLSNDRLMNVKELQEKVIFLQNEVKSRREGFAFDLGVQKTEMGEEQKRLMEENAVLREDLNKLLASRALETRKMEEYAVKRADFEKIITAEVERKATSNVDAVLKSKDSELSAVRGDLEGKLRNAEHMLNVEKVEHAKTRSAGSASLAELQEECRYLYKYAVTVTGVMKMIADGKFPLLEKDGLGVRRFELPAKYMDSQVDVKTRCTYIKGCLERGEELLGQQLAQLGLHGGGGGVAEVEELRAQATKLRDKERARIEAEVMDELSDESTIRYIHDLEAENRKLALKSKADLRMIIDLRLALQSKDRIIAAANGNGGGLKKMAAK